MMKGMARHFADPGLTHVPLRPAPRMVRLPREPFPVIDLRRRSEEVPGYSGNDAFAKAMRGFAVRFAGPVNLKAEEVFSARDVSVFNGSICVGGGMIPGTGPHRRDARGDAFLARMQELQRDGRIPRLPGTTAVIHSPGMGNFFHWTVEAMPRLVRLRHYLAQGIGPIDRIMVGDPRGSPFARTLIEAFFPDLRPRIEFVKAVRHDLDHGVFFLDERTPGPHQTRIGTSTALFAESLEERLAALPSGTGPAVMISRRDVGTRCLLNEAEIAAALRRFDVRLVVLDSLSLDATMRLMASTPLLIGVHGAGLANMMFCRPGTAVLELTTTQFMPRARTYADMAALRGLHYGLAVVDQSGANWVVERNVGNDLEVAPDAMAALTALAASLLSRAALQASA